MILLRAQGIFWTALLLGLTLLSGCAVQRGYEAALVLADIAAGNRPSRLKGCTPEPDRIGFPLVTAARTFAADLYLPGEPSRATVLLIPGAAEEGKDDPRLVAFATTLARARFIVLVPDFPSLRELRVNSGNIGEVSDVFSWLIAHRVLAPRQRAGIIAFSYAVGPVVLAAMHPSIRDRVRFILAVGGYYNLPQVLTFFTTGYFQKTAAGATVRRTLTANGFLSAAMSAGSPIPGIGKFSGPWPIARSATSQPPSKISPKSSAPKGGGSTPLSSIPTGSGLRP